MLGVAKSKSHRRGLLASLVTLAAIVASAATSTTPAGGTPRRRYLSL